VVDHVLEFWQHAPDIAGVGVIRHLDPHDVAAVAELKDTRGAEDRVTILVVVAAPAGHESAIDVLCHEGVGLDEMVDWLPRVFLQQFVPRRFAGVLRQQLGFGPGNQHRGTDQKIETEPFDETAQVGNRLALGSPRHECSKRSMLLLQDRGVAVREKPRAWHAQHVA